MLLLRVQFSFMQSLGDGFFPDVLPPVVVLQPGVQAGCLIQPSLNGPPFAADGPARSPRQRCPVRKSRFCSWFNTIFPDCGKECLLSYFPLMLVAVRVFRRFQREMVSSWMMRYFLFRLTMVFSWPPFPQWGE